MICMKQQGLNKNNNYELAGKHHLINFDGFANLARWLYPDKLLKELRLNPKQICKLQINTRTLR